jgi:GT2 family glycosyltransferase
LLSHRLFRYRQQLKRLFSNLPRRAWLTLKYHGPREVARRIVTFPLRLTPLAGRFGLGPRLGDPSGPARAWYRDHGRPVAVVIPAYGDAGLVEAAVRSVRRTTARERVRIVVADDASAPGEVERLRGLPGVELVLGEETLGFAGNVNRGLAATRADEDVVLLNSDVVAQPGWLEVLQHAAYGGAGPDVGITGPKLLYPDQTIQFGGSIRNPDAPGWFDHRFRFRPADHPPADVMQPSLAITGACLYITRETLDRIGPMDAAYGMAFEDVDWCLRAWEAGKRVIYAPAATLTHHEAKTRGLLQGERELESQTYFWSRWGDWFDRREAGAPGGGLRIVYVTQDTGIGGGHRVVFEHLNGLKARGHEPELWTLDASGPDWYDLDVPVRRFPGYGELTQALAPLDAIKVATWWETAPAVWEAGLRRGIPVYFVQDIETSYYPKDTGVHGRVLATYRPEFTFLTTSQWVHRRLTQYVPSATIIGPGLDTERFRELGLERNARSILALGRSNPLKNFPLTRGAYLKLPEPRPELWLFGIEPDLADGLGARYEVRPDDERVNELLNTAGVFLQTSRHEGFCLPILEAMSAGAPVVCTDAHGNRDFCVDRVNCLMPRPEPRAVAAALTAVLGDSALRERLVEGGRETARRYAWPVKLDELDRFYRELAVSRSGTTPTRTGA